jgi:hypothetical protein
MPMKPKIVGGWHHIFKPKGAEELQKLIKNRMYVWRRKYPEVRGKVVDYIQSAAMTTVELSRLSLTKRASCLIAGWPHGLPRPAPMKRDGSNGTGLPIRCDLALLIVFVRIMVPPSLSMPLTTLHGTTVEESHTSPEPFLGRQCSHANVPA